MIKTKMLTLYADGHATVENLKLGGERMIEAADGNHPVTYDSIWQDAKRLREPIIVFAQFARPAYGAKFDEKDLQRLLYEMKLREKAFKPSRVNRIWWRKVEELGSWLVKYLLLIVAGIVIVWAMWNSFMPGGH